MANLIKFWPILKRLLRYGIPWKKSLYSAFLLLLGSSIAEVLGPILISYYIHNIIEEHYFNTKLVSFIIITFVILQTVAAILNYFQTILFSQIAIKIVQKIRSDVIEAALQQPITTFDTEPIGQIISKVTNDTEVIRELYDTVIVTIFRSSSLIIVILLAMFALEWHMALVSISIFPFILIIMFTYQYYSIPMIRKIRSYLANINNKFNEVINGMEIIQQFSQQKRFKKIIQKTCQQHYFMRMKTLQLDGFLLRPLISLFSAIMLSVLMILFSYFPIGFFKVGVLYAFINYLGRLNEPLIAITTQQSILQQAIVAGERIFELIDSPRQHYGNDKKPLKNGKIEIRNLNFRYKNNSIKVLKNINIFIPEKSFVAFVGQTGSGKSSLANLLMGQYPVENGEIYLDDRRIEKLSHNVLRNGISVVQQDPIILADTVFSNITLGRKVKEEKVLKILKKVQLLTLIQSMKNGIYSMLGEQGNNLSVGQKQLLSIARILITNPKILILDEATANIDSETEQFVQKVLHLIKKKTTLLVIAHRLSTIIQADNIFVLDNGEIVESGDHKSLMIKKGKYWEMHKTQLKIM
ncbi:MAG: SmdB family multidrug efflux ABC transporter permease/ATP-binding protein [Buchnera aphidicola (Tetraneura akinire)]|nr:SmdB family multidrug efflux ABC transporter permease/ATP-binding protein [Buchnera sp. (in: enterobacteria)]